MNKLLETVSSKLAETWVARVLSRAFALWAGGLALWAWVHEGTGALGATRRRRAASDDTSLIVLAVVFLLVVVASGTLVQQTALPMLRLLEGYWPRWLSGPRQWLERRQWKRKQQLEEEWQAVARPVNEGAGHLAQSDRPHRRRSVDAETGTARSTNTDVPHKRPLPDARSTGAPS